MELMKITKNDGNIILLFALILLLLIGFILFLILSIDKDVKYPKKMSNSELIQIKTEINYLNAVGHPV